MWLGDSHVTRLTAITITVSPVVTVFTAIVDGSGGVVGRDVEMNMDVGSSCAGACV